MHKWSKQCYIFFYLCIASSFWKISTSFLSNLNIKEKKSEHISSISCLLVLNGFTLLPSSSPSSWYFFFWLLTYLLSSFSMPSVILWSQLSLDSDLLLKHRHSCLWKTLNPRPPQKYQPTKQTKQKKNQTSFLFMSFSLSSVPQLTISHKASFICNQELFLLQSAAF